MQKIIKFGWLLSFLAVCAISCGSKTQKLNDLIITNASRGKITSKVSCISNKSVSYELFLPTAYDSTKIWPVIFCFDSHGDGRMPANLFSEQADQYGYILICSDDSKNGQSQDVNLGFYDDMLKDVRNRLKIDEKRIYTSGFSGGSRVASSVALYRGGVKGVIGCSAGFATVTKEAQTNFEYLGVVGNEDFNLLEMRQLMKGLEGSPIPHLLLVFKGTHAWPPKSMVPALFSWLEIKAMHSGLIKINQLTVQQFAKSCLDSVAKYKTGYDLYNAWYYSTVASDILKGFPEGEQFNSIVLEMEKSKELKAIFNKNEKTDIKEQQLQQEYLKYLQEKPADWWRIEVSKIQNMGKVKNVNSEAAMYKRILSYLSLAAYMNSTNALKSANYEAADRFITLYSIIDPENPEHKKLRDELTVKKGQY